MPIYGLDDISPQDAFGSHLILAQQGIAGAYPTPASTSPADRLLPPVAANVGTNREAVTDVGMFIPRVYRASELGFTADSQGIENPTIGQSPDRAALQPARVFGRGNIVLVNTFEGLEPWLQDLMNDKSPTVEGVGSISLAAGADLTAAVTLTAIVNAGSIKFTTNDAADGGTIEVDGEDENGTTINETLTFVAGGDTQTTSSNLFFGVATATPSGFTIGTFNAVLVDAYLYTFRLGNTILPGLSAELVRGDIPNRCVGFKDDGLEFSATSDELSSFQFNCISLGYDPNTNASGATYLPGTPGNPPAAVPTTYDAASPGNFLENPEEGFVGYQAGVYFRPTPASDPELLGAFNGRFSMRNNYEPGNELIGGKGTYDRGARRFTRGNSFREIDFEMNLAYSHENADLAAYFLNNTHLTDLSIDFDFRRSAGLPPARLRVNIARGQFSAIPDPSVQGGGEIQVPANLRILPTSTGATDAITIEYEVPVAKGIALQQYI